MNQAPDSLNRYLKGFALAIWGFSRVSGGVFLLGCASLAISRVCQLIAFFLPLKVFIIIHYQEVPGYFGFFPEEMSYREVIAIIAAVVPVMYLLFIALGVVYRWLVDRHLENFGRTELVVGGKAVPEKKVKKLHNHLCKAFAEVGTVFVSILAALILGPKMAVVWLVLLYANLTLFYSKALNAEDHERLTFLKLHRRQFIEYISAANFLVVFVVLALELVYFEMGVYMAIFFLLVSRMVFQGLNRFSVESLYIIKLLPSEMLNSREK